MIRNIPIDSATLAVEQSGSGASIVFLHAGIATRRMWDPQWSLLSQSCRTVRFDMRGFGDSSMVPGKFSATEDTIAILDELGIDSAILMGCSYGGATAIHVAVTHPQRVAGLVLVGSGVHGYHDAEPAPSVFNEMEDAWNTSDYERVLHLEEKAFVVGINRNREELDSTFLNVCREMNRTKLQWEGVDVEYEDDASEDAQFLSSIKVPTLVIVGNEDLPLVQRQAEFISMQIPHANLQVMQNTAHLPNLEEPRVFNDIVATWLSSLQRS